MPRGRAYAALHSTVTRRSWKRRAAARPPPARMLRWKMSPISSRSASRSSKSRCWRRRLAGRREPPMGASPSASALCSTRSCCMPRWSTSAFPRCSSTLMRMSASMRNASAASSQPAPASWCRNLRAAEYTPPSQKQSTQILCVVRQMKNKPAPMAHLACSINSTFTCLSDVLRDESARLVFMRKMRHAGRVCLPQVHTGQREREREDRRNRTAYGNPYHDPKRKRRECTERKLEESGERR